MPDVKAFDSNVERYEQWFVDNPLAYVSELRALRELMPQGGKGVEIGVGTGRFAAPLEITKGIEPSRAMAEVARKRGIEVIHGVAEHMPFADGEFDVALMVTTVCFLDDMDMAFHEIRRILRPGGSFVIGFIDRESPLGREYQTRKDESAFYRNARFYAVDEVISRLVKIGFCELEFRQTLFGPLAEMEEVAPVKDGHGEGSFVVVRGEKQ